MALKVAIVGLPNVGKSTLFNALTRTAAAQAANYPFCTIEPNTGDVAVPEPRLDALAEIAGSKEIIPSRITFVDIAGLVRGASKGEGLPLPAGQAVALAPGGNHLMLLGVQEPLVAGDTVALTLTFATSAPVEVTATVGQPATPGAETAAAPATN